MNRFESNGPAANDPIIIEQVFAEKPNGGIVRDPSFDAPEGTAVCNGASGKYAVMKAYRLVANVASSDTTIKIAKGSGVAANDVIGHGTKGVACTAVDKTNADYDLVTVTMGVLITKGTVLYQAASASANAAVPYDTPLFVTGNYVYAGKGDQPCRLINGANLRKEVANIAPEVAALLPGITLV